MGSTGNTGDRKDQWPMPEADKEDLPCGCKIGTALVAGEPTFVFHPCSLLCPTYAYTLAEMRRQGKPAEFRLVEQ
jgi:hypothetical protein